MDDAPVPPVPDSAMSTSSSRPLVSLARDRHIRGACRCPASHQGQWRRRIRKGSASLRRPLASRCLRGTGRISEIWRAGRGIARKIGRGGFGRGILVLVHGWICVVWFLPSRRYSEVWSVSGFGIFRLTRLILKSYVCMWGQIPDL